jgi:hypothetical protein
MTIALKRCTCGRMPVIRSMKVAEDAVETWVHCQNRRCGAEGERVEDAYSDGETAADLWNRKGGRKL